MQYTAPVPTDLYSRLMAEAYDEREVRGVSTGFQQFFGSQYSSSQTLYSPNSAIVEIDIIRGNEKTGCLIQRGTLGGNNKNSKNASGQNSSNFSRVYPLGEEESTITADQLNFRLAGEQPYAAQEKVDRMRALAFQNHKEHIRRFARMYERLSVQSVLTGKMDAILGTSNVNLQYDFRRNTDNTFTPVNKWDVGAAATIMADIDAACDISRINGKLNPDMAIVGGGAMEAMLGNDAFQKKSDNRRFGLISINMEGVGTLPDKFQRFVDGGMQWRGKIITSKGYELYLFTYVDGYTDAAGDFQKYMPEDQFLVTSCEARCDRYFGPNEHLPNATARLDAMANYFGIQNPETMGSPEVKGDMVISAAMFHYDAYATHDNKAIVCRTQTAPIFATTQTDSFVLIEDLLTP